MIARSGSRSTDAIMPQGAWLCYGRKKPVFGVLRLNRWGLVCETLTRRYSHSVTSRQCYSILERTQLFSLVLRSILSRGLQSLVVLLQQTSFRGRGRCTLHTNVRVYKMFTLEACFSEFGQTPRIFGGVHVGKGRRQRRSLLGYW